MSIVVMRKELNLVEGWFDEITNKRIRRVNRSGADELEKLLVKTLHLLRACIPPFSLVGGARVLPQELCPQK